MWLVSLLETKNLENKLHLKQFNQDYTNIISIEFWENFMSETKKVCTTWQLL